MSGAAGAPRVDGWSGVAAYELGKIRTDRGEFLDKGNYVFDVRHPDFGNGGAKCNGVADDTAAILDAYAHAVASGARTKIVYLPAGTFRTSSWLDIDHSDVEFRGAGKLLTIIKPIDGADVGGFRVGNSTAVSRVTIRGIGYDGNDLTMTAAVKRLDGFIFDQATDCELADFYATRTHPYHEHTSGGSGVTCTELSTRIHIHGGLVDDIGDRCIQVAGVEHHIHDNTLINGYDRGVSLNYQDSTPTRWGASRCNVHDNYISNMSDGSAIGVANVAVHNNHIHHNTAHGTYRGVVQIDFAGSTGNVIENNLALHDSEASSQPAFILQDYDVLRGNVVIEALDINDLSFQYFVDVQGDNAQVVDNTFICTATTPHGPWVVFIRGEDCLVRDNLMYGCQIGVRVNDDAARPRIIGNDINQFGYDGDGAGIFIEVAGNGGAIIKDNTGRTTRAPQAWIVSENAGSFSGIRTLSGNVLIASGVTAYDLDGGRPDRAHDNDPAFAGEPLPVYTVATLPSDGEAGDYAYASDALKVGESAAGGTGTMVYHDGTEWRRVGDDTTAAD